MSDRQITPEEAIGRLKIKAYDLISQGEFVQSKLGEVNKQIAQLSQKILKEREAKEAEEKKKQIEELEKSAEHAIATETAQVNKEEPPVEEPPIPSTGVGGQKEPVKEGD